MRQTIHHGFVKQFAINLNVLLASLQEERFFHGQTLKTSYFEAVARKRQPVARGQPADRFINCVLRPWAPGNEQKITDIFAIQIVCEARCIAKSVQCVAKRKYTVFYT